MEKHLKSCIFSSYKTSINSLTFILEVYYYSKKTYQFCVVMLNNVIIDILNTQYCGYLLYFSICRKETLDHVKHAHIYVIDYLKFKFTILILCLMCV